jgi:hypothetical protein
VVDLAKQWVQEEVGVALDKAWTRLETKTYVGGDGKGGTQPLPFFLDEVSRGHINHLVVSLHRGRARR